VKGELAGIPNGDARLDRCSALLGQPRLSCYEALDRYLMTQVVPWVPYYSRSQVQHLVGTHVTQWSSDQFSGDVGYAHVAVSS
jgi:hypothetical protein